MILIYVRTYVKNEIFDWEYNIRKTKGKGKIIRRKLTVIVDLKK